MALPKRKWDNFLSQRLITFIISSFYFLEYVNGSPEMINLLLVGSSTQNECEKVCDNTFVNLDEVTSCRRGCRFYTYPSISSSSIFLNPFEETSGGEGKEDVKSTCISLCKEAYEDDEDGNEKACNLGCEASANYSNTPTALQEEAMDNGDFMTSMLGFDPFNIFDQMLQSPLNGGVGSSGRLGDSVSMSWSSSSHTDEDGNLVILDSPPRMVITHYGPDGKTVEVLGDGQDDVPSAELSQLEQTEEQLITSKQKERENALYAPDSDSVASLSDTDDLTAAANSDADDVIDDADGGGSKGGDWLGCISFKSGLPHWLLLATMSLSVLAMIYLCLSTMSTSRKHKQATCKSASDDVTSNLISNMEIAAVAAQDDDKKISGDDAGVFFIVPIHGGDDEKKKAAMME